MRRFVFLMIIVIAIVVGSVLELTGMFDTMLLAIFSQLSTVTSIFVIIIGGLVIGNIYLAAVSSEPKEPYGTTMSFARAVGPFVGGVFNVLSAGYLTYTCFLTATTIFRLDFEGKLSTLLLPQTVGFVLSLMYIILTFAAYSLYSLFRLIWIHPYLQEQSPVKAIPTK